MNQKDCFVKHCSIFTTKEDFLKVPMSSSTSHNYHQSFFAIFLIYYSDVVGHLSEDL